MNRFFSLLFLSLLLFSVANAEIVTSDLVGWDWMYNSTDYKVYFLDEPQTSIPYQVVFPDGSIFTLETQALRRLPNMEPSNAYVVGDNLYYFLFTGGLMGSFDDNSYVNYFVSPTGMKQNFVIYADDVNLPFKKEVTIANKIQPTSDLSIWLDDGTEWEGMHNKVTTVTSYFTVVDANNRTLFNFPVLEAYDSNGSMIYLNYKLIREAGPNMFMEIDIPVDFLNSAVYPIIIDPSWMINSSTNTTPNYAAKMMPVNFANVDSGTYYSYVAGYDSPLSNQFSDDGNYVSYLGIFPVRTTFYNAGGGGGTVPSATDYKTFLYKVIITDELPQVYTNVMAITDSPVLASFTGTVKEYDKIPIPQESYDSADSIQYFFKIPKDWSDSYRNINIYSLQTNDRWIKMTTKYESEDVRYWFLNATTGPMTVDTFVAIEQMPSEIDWLTILIIALIFIGFGLMLWLITDRKKKKE